MMTFFLSTLTKIQHKNQVWDQVHGWVRKQARELVRHKVCVQTSCLVYDQVTDQVTDQVSVQVRSQVRNQW